MREHSCILLWNGLIPYLLPVYIYIYINIYIFFYNKCAFDECSMWSLLDRFFAPRFINCTPGNQCIHPAPVALG